MLKYELLAINKLLSSCHYALSFQTQPNKKPESMNKFTFSMFYLNNLSFLQGNKPIKKTPNLFGCLETLLILKMVPFPSDGF